MYPIHPLWVWLSIYRSLDPPSHGSTHLPDNIGNLAYPAKGAARGETNVVSLPAAGNPSNPPGVNSNRGLMNPIVPAMVSNMGFGNILMPFSCVGLDPPICMASLLAANSKLFREYTGAKSDSVKLTDVPINPHVEFHFILAFAIDYTDQSHPSPTNCKFNAFWEPNHLGPTEIATIKSKHPNVKVAASLGADSTGNNQAFFASKSKRSWIQSAISSLTTMIKHYNLDGIDIDYEHVNSDPNTFAQCIGQLITGLKKKKVVSFHLLPSHLTMTMGQCRAITWLGGRSCYSRYSTVTTAIATATADTPVNLNHTAKATVTSDGNYNNRYVTALRNEQKKNYGEGQVLASFISGGGQGLGPEDGFFEACDELVGEGKLGGIFVWCAVESRGHGFKYEKKSQDLLVSA
ncbi:hypothetical protein HYC85_006994 [Camellia sinensis]|uniref:GH18 domain-containing protein n=1 Tax=Camellia sinensis TaxID=4442 RepID=A0A7J7HQ70_CAMSI|nr:hypothetical protein HYC85_006994 [Camellia sinensis]